MRKFLLLTTAVLLMTSYAFAQDSANGPNAAQCQQIMSAVAQYGYAAARQHALETYGPEAVKFGDQCFSGRPRRISSRTIRSRRPN
jgi:hypothetical protein